MTIPFPTDRVAIARNDDVYECVPDVALLDGKTLLCVYRESDSHVARQYAHLVYRTSDDFGRTWSDRRVLIEAPRTPDSDFEKWNCPRVGQLSDGCVYILCDKYPVDRGREDEGSSTFIWWRCEDGTWDGPHDTGVFGIVPDRICELPSGRLLLGTHWYNGETKHLTQTVAHSDDGGATWSDRNTVASSEDLDLCEGSILRLPDGELVCYMRENSRLGLPMYKSISTDDGTTWSAIAPTLMAGGHRAVAGLTPSGAVMVTYRQTIGGSETIGSETISASEHAPHNTFAYRESIASAIEMDPRKQSGTILPIDHDRSPNPDNSYTGWVNLPDGRIFIVNYIVDDAPRAQIRGYWVDEHQFTTPV